MQANEITLAVDVLNNGSTTNALFKRIEELASRSTYRGPNGSLATRDNLSFFRTYPKRSGDFLGAAKTSVKFTKDQSVANASGTGMTTAPLIAEVSFSIPVGASPAQVKEMRQRLIAILDDETVMVALHEYLEI